MILSCVKYFTGNRKLFIELAKMTRDSRLNTMTLLKNSILILCTILLSFSILAKDKKKSDFNTYKGAFFEAEYPKNFTVKSSIKSSMPDLYDSAFFISPDKKVRFYVFAPQWSGDADDIAINSDEIEKDTKTESKNGMKFKWFTYEKKDKSRLRSYQETTNEEETTKLIVGIEYTDREAYKKYKDEYLKFKKSIRQFAD